MVHGFSRMDVSRWYRRPVGPDPLQQLPASQSLFSCRFAQLSATIRLGKAKYEITILNPDHSGKTIKQVTLDSRLLPVTREGAVFAISDEIHKVVVTLGETPS